MNRKCRNVSFKYLAIFWYTADPTFIRQLFRGFTWAFKVQEATVPQTDTTVFRDVTPSSFVNGHGLFGEPVTYIFSSSMRKVEASGSTRILVQSTRRHIPENRIV